MANGQNGALLIETAAEKEARERAEEQRTDRRYRTLQLWFNGALMLASIVTVGIVLYQNHIFNATLTEMRTQSGVAKTAADAARVAAQATENQVPIQLGQLDIARDAINEANKTAETQLAAQRQALEVERPSMGRACHRRERIPDSLDCLRQSGRSVVDMVQEHRRDSGAKHRVPLQPANSPQPFRANRVPIYGSA